MQKVKLLKNLGVSLAGFGALFVLGDACAAQGGVNTGRAAHGRLAGSIVAATNSMRMPTMPTLPGMAVGNTTQNVPSVPSVPSVPDVPDVPNVPDMPIIPNIPDTPILPDVPGNQPQPDNPVVGCADGGIENSTYTVENCMDDVLRCVNSGAAGLVGGLNELFNPDIRHSIENGMGICSNEIAKCVSDVRLNCSNVYRGTADVWVDFNSRRVQPEYFSFVLRKTGLTPNQAEKVCLMLDKNVQGSSFEANVTEAATSYAKQYSGVLVQNKSDLTKGVETGRFARWDAASATCHIRVGAYNKDEQITNTWLFGAAGDDRVAEVWKAAGETFNCNKDLFGFSLMKDTSTAAVVGVGGGTLLGAGVGALAGHGDQVFDCANNNHRKQLMDLLRRNANIAILGEYMVSSQRISASDSVLSEEQCYEIVDLYDTYREIRTAVDACGGKTNVHVIHELELVCAMDLDASVSDAAALTECFKLAATQKPEFQLCVDNNLTDLGACVDLVVSTMNSSVTVSAEQCTNFKPINQAKLEGAGIYCTPGSAECQTREQIDAELMRLGGILMGDVATLLSQGIQGNRGKTTAIGAASGAAAGGLATAITAFVEKNNITCRVGDNLEQVPFNKNHSIGSLRDFYVKWNLKLPETISPSANVTDCTNWTNMCAMYTDLSECQVAQFNYKPAGASQIIMVPSACAVSGSACVPNYPVTKSHGICK